MGSVLICTVGVLPVGAATAIAAPEQSPGSSGGGGPKPAAEGQATSVQPVQRYRLQKGDGLELTFPFATDFNQTKTVQPDGFINLRSIGDLKAEGLTVTELSEALRDRYATIMRDAAVSVELKDFERPYFVAVGALERPGKYELRGVTTLTQALAVAGGFKADAKRSNVDVFRRSPDGTGGVQLQRIDVTRLLASRDLTADLVLQSGDLVSVPRRRVPSLLTVSQIVSSVGWLAVLITRR